MIKAKHLQYLLDNLPDYNEYQEEYVNIALPPELPLYSSRYDKHCTTEQHIATFRKIDGEWVLWQLPIER